MTMKKGRASKGPKRSAETLKKSGKMMSFRFSVRALKNLTFLMRLPDPPASQTALIEDLLEKAVGRRTAKGEDRRKAEPGEGAHLKPREGVRRTLRRR